MKAGEAFLQRTWRRPWSVSPTRARTSSTRPYRRPAGGTDAAGQGTDHPPGPRRLQGQVARTDARRLAGQHALYRAAANSGRIALASCWASRKTVPPTSRASELNSARYIHLLAESRNACSPTAPTTSATRTSQGPGGAPDRSGIPEAACRRGQSDGDLADRRSVPAWSRTRPRTSPSSTPTAAR